MIYGCISYYIDMLGCESSQIHLDSTSATLHGRFFQGKPQKTAAAVSSKQIPSLGRIHYGWLTYPPLTYPPRNKALLTIGFPK